MVSIPVQKFLNLIRFHSIYVSITLGDESRKIIATI